MSKRKEPDGRIDRSGFLQFAFVNSEPAGREFYGLKLPLLMHADELAAFYLISNASYGQVRVKSTTFRGKTGGLQAGFEIFIRLDDLVLALLYAKP